jgi:hypothetical protein
MFSFAYYIFFQNVTRLVITYFYHLCRNIRLLICDCMPQIKTTFFEIGLIDTKNRAPMNHARTFTA